MHENGASGPTAVTYGGVSLTLSKTVVVNAPDDFSETGYLWTLVNPPTGLNDVVISGNAGGRDGGATAAVYTGVDQASPIGNTAVNSALSPTSATTVSITKQSEDNTVVWAYVVDQGQGGLSAAADNTALVIAETALSSTKASSFGTGYRTLGVGVVLVGVVDSAGGSPDNGIAAMELIASAPVSTGPATPINPGAINILTTSARLTWEQG